MIILIIDKVYLIIYQSKNAILKREKILF